MDEDKYRLIANPHDNANFDTIEDATSFETEDMDEIQSGHFESIDVDEQDDEDRSGKLKSMVGQHFERKKFVLDPRYKIYFIEYYYPKIFNFEADVEIEKIKKICYDLLEEYQRQSAMEVDATDNSSHHTTMGNFSYHEDKFSNFDA
ncbi:hypothetical protein Ancab_012828 [Ancistrocladus abbreviatus]